MCVVPAAHIHEVWDVVVKNYFSKKCKSPAATRILDYVEKSYIGRKRTRKLWVKPTFAHSLWNKVEALEGGSILTNNSVETFNRNWNASVPRRASVQQTIRAFQREARLSVVTMREMKLGLPQNISK